METQRTKLCHSDCLIDVTNFLPSNREWLAFTKCIVQDDVDDLKIFSGNLQYWTAFLQSSDVSGMWSDCSPQFVHTFAIGDATHPFPTNPFFVAIFYNAQKCLTFMHQSGVDFSKITEHGFTAYHILFDAIRFMSRDHHEHVHMHGTATDSQVSAECSKLVSLFHDTLFTSEQQQHMLQSVCRFGMTPMSWGVFLGLANHVEYIMRYYAADTMVQSDAVGLNERVSIDVSEFVGENPSFFTSPICILLDLYGQSDLAQIKALGIFRSGFIWRQWVEALYNRNRIIVTLIVINTFTLTLAAMFIAGASVNEYLKAKCSGNVGVFPVGVIVILLYWLLNASCGIAGSLYCIRRKEQFRRQCGYPKSPRKNYYDMIFWFLPWTLGMPVSFFLLWAYIDPGRSCTLLGQYIFPASGCCILLLLLSSVSLIVSYLRLVPHLTTVTSSLYKSIGIFTIFIVFYLMLTGVFSRIFESSFIFSKASNSTLSRPDESVSEFLKAFYQTFLVSLNIVDTSVFIPAGDRIDLNVTHVFYILFVPVLFINFVIGILTSVVAHVHEHSVENKYLLMLSVAEFSEMVSFSLRSVLRNRRCLPRGSIKLGICEPIKQKSKLIRCNKDLLANMFESNKPL